VPYGLYISAEGAYAQNKRMEVLANNLANAATTAFKRDQPVFQARLAEATARALDFPGSGTINDLGGGVEVMGTVTDFSQGGARQTGNPSDLTINGEAFFVVQRGPDRLLSRAGNFLFNPDGQLVTAEGYPVLSDDLTPIAVDPTLPVQFTPDGCVQQGGDRFPLALVRPRSLGDLVKTGDNLYAPLAPAVPLPLEERNVVSGSLETSGIKPATEMVELIETSRAFEANVTLIRSFDQLLGSLVNNVLKEG
jgi:flagellar basal-body rod protein FlgF/flagellar basal-body rod protein FlgG